MYYDRNHEYMKDRNFWLGMIVLGMGMSYSFAKFTVESDRRAMWTRIGSIEDLNGDDFVNRGGVLVSKLKGIEKYYANMPAMLGWGQKA